MAFIDKIRATTGPFWFETEGMDFDIETKTVTGELTGIKNNKTMKYRVLTNQLRNVDKYDIIELNETGYNEQFYYVVGGVGRISSEIIERNPEWFEPVEEVQEGQYRFCTRNKKPYRINKRMPDGRYVILWLYEYGNDCTELVSKISLEGDRKLSTPEIEQAIKDEAKRRGFKDGQQVKRGWAGVSEESTIKGDVASGGYFPMDDSFLMSEFGMIYKEGEFAEIVDQTPTIEINGYEAEEKNGLLKFGCIDVDRSDAKVLRDAIHKYDLNIIRDGEKINKQIHQIYEYYKEKENYADETVQISGTVDVSDFTVSAESMWVNND